MKEQQCRKIKSLLYIIMLLMFILTACGKDKSDDVAELSLEENSESVKVDGEKEEPLKDQKKTVFVYVCGAVHAPGVYELPDTGRIYDAIVAAGGVKQEAAGEYLNHAKLLTDGEQIYIPTKDEVKTGGAEGLVPDIKGGATDTAGKININTASKEELMTLSGIGEAKADHIILYRDTNGGFQKVEDLMQIEGIKEGVFNKIKEQITV